MKKSKMYAIFLVIAWQAVTLSCGPHTLTASTKVSIATNTATAVNTIMPPTEAQTRPTAAPSPTQASNNGQMEVLEYIYSEDFSKPPADWDLTPLKNKDVEIHYAITDGVYSWIARADNDYPIMKIPDPGIFLPEDNFLISVAVKVIPAEYAAVSGIIFRFQDFENFYYAKLDAFGAVSVFALQNNQWILLAGPVESEHWTAGKLNRLIVIDHSGHYELQVNDYPVLDFSDDRFLGGKAGLIAELNAGMEETFVFDDFRVMKTGDSAAAADEIENSVAIGGGRYSIYEGDLGGVSYTMKLSASFLYSSDGDWDKFCLDEDPNLCVGVLHQNGNWNDPEEMANELIATFSQEVTDLQISHQQHTTTADGFNAYWVGTTYTRGGLLYEGSHLFVLVQHVGFEIMGFGQPEIMKTYQPVIKAMMESFSLGYN